MSSPPPKSGSPGHPVGTQQKAWAPAPRRETCRVGQNQYSPAACGALHWLSGSLEAETLLRWAFVCVAGEFGAYGPFSVGQLAGEHSLGRGGQLNGEPEGEPRAPGERHVPVNCEQCTTSLPFPVRPQNLPPRDYAGPFSPWTYDRRGNPAPLTPKGAAASLQHGAQPDWPPPCGARPAAAQKAGWSYVPPGEGGLPPPPQGRRSIETYGEGTAVTHTQVKVLSPAGTSEVQRKVGGPSTGQINE